MWIRRVLPGVLCVALGILCYGSDGFAVAYKYRYVDAKGEAHFADKQETVPERYRASATIVSVEDVDEKAQAAAEEERSRAAGTMKATEAAARVQQMLIPAKTTIGLPKSVSLIWSGAAAVSVFAIMTVLGWIDALRERERILNGIRTVLFLLLAGYLVIAHGMDVIGLFSRVGSTISTMEQESADRGKKAAQFYKSMETMVEQAERLQRTQEAQVKELSEHP